MSLNKLESEAKRAIHLAIELKEKKEKTAKLETNIAELEKNLKEIERYVVPSLRGGLCPADQLETLPVKIREWTKKNADNWKDCRISGAWTGGRAKPLGNNLIFKCDLDSLRAENPKDYCIDVTIYLKKNLLAGLSIKYASGSLTNHGYHRASSELPNDISSQDTFDLGNWGRIIGVAVHESKSFQVAIIDGLRLTQGTTGTHKWNRADGDGYFVSGIAPPGYVLKGFWSE